MTSTILYPAARELTGGGPIGSGLKAQADSGLSQPEL